MPFVYTYSKSSFNFTYQSCENRIARLVVKVSAEAQVLYRASPCGICGGQSVNGTGFSLPPSTSEFAYQVSCHQCSILIHSSIIDAILRHQPTVSLNEALLSPMPRFKSFRLTVLALTEDHTHTHTHTHTQITVHSLHCKEHLYTVVYATTNAATTIECYKEQFLSIKSGCYNECVGILSADVARACALRVGPSCFN